MSFQDDTKQNLAQFILGDAHPPYRTGSELVIFMNKFGYRDVYRGKLPINPNNYIPYARKSYVEDRLFQADDNKISDILEYTVNQFSENDKSLPILEEIINRDGYSIINNGEKYIVTGGNQNRNIPVQNIAHFQRLESQIISALDRAQVSIWVLMAWFTNNALKDKLLEKQAQGVEVRLGIYDDGINARYGVDFTGLSVIRIKKGQRGGLMHNKFCVIDNQIIITGSYNWTNNAETRNDENVFIADDPKMAIKYSLEYKNLTTIK